MLRFHNKTLSDRWADFDYNIVNLEVFYKRVFCVWCIACVVASLLVSVAMETDGFIEYMERYSKEEEQEPINGLDVNGK